MDTARSLTYNIKVVADTAQAQSNINSLISNLSHMGQNSININANTSQANANLNGLNNSLNGLNNNLGNTNNNLGNTNNQVTTLTSSFRKSFLAGIDSGKSFSESLKSGVGGAYDHAADKATQFGLRVLSGAQRISEGFRNPIQTIRTGFGSAISSAQSKITSMIRGAENATSSLNNIGNAANNAAGNVTNLGNAAEQSGNKFGSLGTVVGGAAVAAGVAAGAFVKSSIDVGMEFDKSVSQIAATMGKNMEEFGQIVGKTETPFGHFEGTLREFALYMSSNTAFSATEAAQALNYMALAGYDAQTSMNMLPTVLNLAAAGGIKLSDASDMITDAQSALGLSLEQTTIMVDQMAMASSKSNTSVEQLGQAILQVGGTAKVMAGGTQELNTVLGILADNGIKGGEGGTHLRNMLLKLAHPTQEAAAVIDKLGLNFFDAQGKMRSFADIFPEMNEAMSKLTDQEKLEAISTLFNSYDIASVNALMSTSKDRWTKLGEAIGDSAGAADKMSRTQLDNLAGDVTIFKSALEGAQIAVSDKFSPALRGITQIGTEALSELTQAFSGKDDGLGEAMGKLGVKISEGLSTAFEGMPDVMEKGMAFIQTLADGIAAGIPLVCEKVPELISQFISFLAANGPSFIEQGTHIITTLGEGIINGIPALLGQLPSIISSIIDFIVSNAPAIIGAGAEIITSLAIGLVGAIPSVLSALASIAAAILSGLASVPGMMIDVGVNIVEGVWNGISSAGASLIGRVTNFFSGIVSSVKASLGIASPSRVFAEIGDNMALGVGQGFGETIGGVTADIEASMPKDLKLPDIEAPDINSLLDGITSALSGLVDIGANAFSKLTETFNADGLINVITTISTLPLEGLNSIFESLTGIDAIGEISEVMSSLADSIASSIPSIVEQVPELINQIISSFTESVPAIAEQGMQLVSNLGAGIAANAPMILEYTSPVIAALLDFLASNAPALLNSGLEIISSFASGVAQGIPNVITAVSALGSDILSSLSSLPGMMASIGVNIVEGVWQGISSAGASLVGRVTSLFSGIVSSVKSSLGIASPSKVFAEIGDNMALGVDKGFGETIGGVTKNIEAAVPKELDLPTINAPDVNYEINPVVEEGALTKATHDIENLQKDALGNIQGLDIPEYNQIEATDSLVVREAKEVAQHKLLDNISIPDISYGVIPIAEEFNPTSPNDVSYAVSPIVEDVVTPTVSDISYGVKPIVKEPQHDELGNIKGIDIPEYNRITKYDDLGVVRDKQIAQEKMLDLAYTATPVFEELNPAVPDDVSYSVNPIVDTNIQTPDVADISYSVKPLVETLQRDELGNIKGIEIPEYNRINENDSLIVREAKETAQEKIIKPIIEKTDLPIPETVTYDVLPNIADLITPSVADVSYSVNPLISDVVVPDVADITYGVNPMIESPQRDELGNIKGIDIPEYNQIKEGDSLTVQEAKRIAQEKLLANSIAPDDVSYNVLPNIADISIP